MKKNVIIVTHKDIAEQDDELVTFLNEKKYNNVMHVCHSMCEVPNRRSYYSWFKDGKLYQNGTSPDFIKFPEPIIYTKEIFYTFFWVLKTNIVWDTYIGMDGLCALIGNLLRLLHKTRKTVYWAIDFVPTSRFSLGIVNKIYHAVNSSGYKTSDEMWDLSPRMAEAREGYLGITKSDYKKLRIVPHGMWSGRIKKYSYEECEKHTLVFIGRLLEGQGVQLVFKAMPIILKSDPEFVFRIIGAGPYFSTLIDLSRKEGVYEHCEFLGRIEDPREAEERIAKSVVSIAPYIRRLDKWTYYADPGKIKTYLGCGVPTLLTDLPWNAKEIVDSKCGEIVTEDASDIAKKILDLMNPDKNKQYRRNAITYAQKFDYNTIFNGLDL